MKGDRYKALDRLGRVRLSKRFFMRDFLTSEIAMAYGLVNLPQNEDIAIEAGMGLCENLLEPLADRFGRIHIRSAFRSCEVNALGNARDHNCSRNELNFAGHIWDRPREDDQSIGATACIVIPSFFDAFDRPGDWTELAWWIHDHLAYNSMVFFTRKTRWAFNLNWNSLRSDRRIKSWEGRFDNGNWTTKRILTEPGMANHASSHAREYARLEERIPVGG